MQLSGKTKKKIRYALTATLLTGMVVVTGFLSFTGALLLKDSIYCALSAFFLAGVIEGEIYAQQINSSLLKIFSKGYLKKSILAQKLNELMHSERYKKEKENYPFLTLYKENMSYLAKKEALHDHSGDDTDIHRSLKWMRRDLEALVDGKTSDSPFYRELNSLLSEGDLNALRQTIKRKTKLNYFAWAINLIGGFSSFLVGLALAKESLLILSAHFGFALSATLASTSIIGLALIGAIGYVHLIHNTLSAMIEDDTFKTWKKKIVTWWKKPKPQDNSAFYFYGKKAACGLGLFLVACLGTFATIATAGTWWNYAQAGAKMIRTITAIGAISVIVMGVSTLTFNVLNSLQSALGLAKFSFSKAYELLKNKLDRYRKAENMLQFCNPLRFVLTLITFPAKLLTFAGHLISMGVMSDKLEGIDPALTTTLNGGSEFFQDWHMIFPEATQCQKESKKDEIELPQEDHVHFDLTGKLIKYVILGPVYALAGIWDYAASQLNRNHSDQKMLGLWEAIKKSFLGLAKPALPKPVQTNTALAWKAYEDQARVDKFVQKHALSDASIRQAIPSALEGTKAQVKVYQGTFFNKAALAKLQNKFHSELKKDTCPTPAPCA